MVSVYVSRWYVEGEEEKVGKKGGYEKGLNFLGTQTEGKHWTYLLMC